MNGEPMICDTQCVKGTVLEDESALCSENLSCICIGEKLRKPYLKNDNIIRRRQIMTRSRTKKHLETELHNSDSSLICLFDGRNDKLIPRISVKVEPNDQKLVTRTRRKEMLQDTPTINNEADAVVTGDQFNEINKDLKRITRSQVRNEIQDANLHNEIDKNWQLAVPQEKIVAEQFPNVQILFCLQKIIHSSEKQIYDEIPLNHQPMVCEQFNETPTTQERSLICVQKLMEEEQRKKEVNKAQDSNKSLICVQKLAQNRLNIFNKEYPKEPLVCVQKKRKRQQKKKIQKKNLNDKNSIIDKKLICIQKLARGRPRKVVNERPSFNGPTVSGVNNNANEINFGLNQNNIQEIYEQTTSNIPQTINRKSRGNIPQTTGEQERRPINEASIITDKSLICVRKKNRRKLANDTSKNIELKDGITNVTNRRRKKKELSELKLNKRQKLKRPPKSAEEPNFRNKQTKHPRRSAKRSRSDDEIDKIIVNSKKYLEENPEELNIENCSILSLKNVRENMNRNKDAYIAKRVIGLVAEQVIKKNLKSKLYTEYISELNNFQFKFPDQLKESLNNDGVIESFEQILDNIEINSTYE